LGHVTRCRPVASRLQLWSVDHIYVCVCVCVCCLQVTCRNGWDWERISYFASRCVNDMLLGWFHRWTLLSLDTFMVWVLSYYQRSDEQRYKTRMKQWSWTYFNFGAIIIIIIIIIDKSMIPDPVESSPAVSLLHTAVDQSSIPIYRISICNKSRVIHIN